jgi:hypothetical protein
LSDLPDVIRARCEPEGFSFYSTNRRKYKMKKLLVSALIALALVLTFGLVFVGCDDPTKSDNESNDDDPTTVGELTVSGLDAYNGKWAVARYDIDADWRLWAFGYGGSSGEKGILISGGTVVLPVYKQSRNDWKLYSYEGNDTVNMFIRIIEAEHYDGAARKAEGTKSVTFSEGVGAITITGEVTDIYISNDFDITGTWVGEIDGDPVTITCLLSDPPFDPPSQYQGEYDIAVPAINHYDTGIYAWNGPAGSRYVLLVSNSVVVGRGYFTNANTIRIEFTDDAEFTEDLIITKSS